MVAAVISYQNTVLIRQRQKQGLLGGLWEFPNFTTEQPKKALEILPKELQTHFNCQVQVQNAIAVLQHAYTHFRVTLHVYRCCWIDGQPASQADGSPRWVSLQQLPDYPMGKLDRQIAQRLLASQSNDASIKEGKFGQN
jgi:A/G-specific adenine glycosylase